MRARGALELVILDGEEDGRRVVDALEEAERCRVVALEFVDEVHGEL